MRRILLASVALSVVFSSCKNNDKTSMITGKWQAVSLDNPHLNKLMEEQHHFLDTFGKDNTPEQNIAIYGFSNIDSARLALKEEMLRYMSQQEHAVKNTWFNFRKDGVVLMNFSGQLDSTKWHIDDAGALLLDETTTGSTSGKLKMEILQLTDTMLKLQLNDKGMSSTVIFKPTDK